MRGEGLSDTGAGGEGGLATTGCTSTDLSFGTGMFNTWKVDSWRNAQDIYQQQLLCTAVAVHTYTETVSILLYICVSHRRDGSSSITYSCVLTIVKCCG